LLMIHYFTPWPWPLTLNICNVSPFQIWTQSNNPRRSYCDFSVWPY